MLSLRHLANAGGGNLLLVISKGLVAYLSHSAAIYADAANSAADMLYSLLMALVLTIAQQLPDSSHPQGHSQFEPLAGLLIALGMGLLVIISTIS